MAIYLGALAVGAAVGLAVPGVAEPAGAAVTPVLALLLYATFMGVPFGLIGESVRDVRFLVTVLAVNFMAAPLVVFGLSRFVAHEPVLLVGVLFVLLTPCIDYVIAFTGLAGGARDRLLAATPLLMLAQMVLLPIYLMPMAGAVPVQSIDRAAFLQALLWFIVVPLAAAMLTQLVARRARVGRAAQVGAGVAMVPLMALTLALVVASQVHAVGQQLSSLLLLVPVFVAFAALMVLLGLVAGRIARLDVSKRRAIVLSGVTRNSLVVLPLVLALPAGFELAPLVVVTQTLVELLLLVLLVRLLPRLIR